MTTKKIILIIAIVAIVGALFWTIYHRPFRNDDFGANTAVSSAPNTSHTLGSSEGKADVDSPVVTYGYEAASSTATKETTEVKDAPSLNRPVVIPASFSATDVALVKESISKLIDAIKKNPPNGALWADLGMERKGIEDYEGAKEAYEYALKLMPNNATVADSLGVIYGDYLKDYPKAEQHFRLALTLDPTASYLYMRLFEFYRYALKDTGKAKAILEEGLRVIPGDPSFKVLLETM